MLTHSYGIFTVNSQEVCTGIYVQAGETIRTLSNGLVNFGSHVGVGAPVLNANGDDWSTPSDYPAPALRKNSLICKVAGVWYQGGVNASFTPRSSGQLTLFCNDGHPADNSRGWEVTISRESSDDAYLPRPSSSGALFQSLAGNLELLATKRQSDSAGSGSGDLFHIARGDSAGVGWSLVTGNLTRGDDSGSSGRIIRRENAYLFPCWFQATDGSFWGVCVQNRQVKYFACSMAPLHPSIVSRTRFPRDVTGADRCSGAPAMIQSSHGLRGNYEVLVPTEAGGLIHFSADNNSNSRCEPAVWSGTDGISWNRISSFGRGNPVHAVRLMESSYGNLEAVAMEEAGRGGQQELVFYWQNGPGGPWSPGFVLPNSTGRVRGIPAFIQSSFGTEFGNPGNLEVLAPAVDGGLLHWYRPHGGSWAWMQASARGIHTPGGTRYDAVNMIQGTYRWGGSPHGNFEVVAQIYALPYGNSSFKFYWRNNFAGEWNGPSNIPVVL